MLGSPLQLIKLINPNLNDAGGGQYAPVPSGNLAGVYVNTTGQGNAAATTNTVLWTLALPPGAFNANGQSVTIVAAGKTAANGNNKVVQCYVGSDLQTVGSAIVTTATTSIATSGVQTTNNGGWNLEAGVWNVGGNAQLGLDYGIVMGTTHLGTAALVPLTLNTANPIYLSITGASSTTGAANDVVAQVAAAFWTN